MVRVLQNRALAETLATCLGRTDATLTLIWFLSVVARGGTVVLSGVCRYVRFFLTRMVVSFSLALAGGRPRRRGCLCFVLLFVAY